MPFTLGVLILIVQATEQVTSSVILIKVLPVWLIFPDVVKAPPVSSDPNVTAKSAAEADSASGRRFGKIAPEARMARTKNPPKIPNFLLIPSLSWIPKSLVRIACFACGLFMYLANTIAMTASAQIAPPMTADDFREPSVFVKIPVSEDPGVVVVDVVSISETGVPVPLSSKTIFVSPDADIVFPFSFLC